jgi:dipeptidyl aminopeptidase/acylaminoacyl peptidase
MSHRESTASAGAAGAAFTRDDLRMTVAGIETAVTRWRPLDGPVVSAVVVCHGGVDGIDAPCEEAAGRLAAGGLAVLAPHYRGEDGITGDRDIGVTDVDDVLAAVDLAAGSGTVALWGQSRGGFVALLAAARRAADVAGVVVTAPIDSVAFLHDVMAERGHAVAAEIATRIGGTPRERPAEYAARDAGARAADLHGQRVLVAHAADDTVVPVQRSLDLVARLCGHCEVSALFPVAGGHRVVYETSGPVWRALVDFLRDPLVAASGSPARTPA